MIARELQLVNQVRRAKKAGREGATYLASDISSLAKTLQHYRFEGTFSGGLQKLITTIRSQSPAVPKQDKTDSKNAVTGDKQSLGKAADSGATAAATKRKAGDSAVGDATVARSKLPSTANSIDKSAAADAPASKRQRKLV